jgi:sulfide:quinone oxidoreductase
MTRTAKPALHDLHVLVAGGGVAGLETALALRALAPEAVGVEIVAPELHFFYRPLSVSEPFGGLPVRRWELADLTRAIGVDFTPGMLERVDPEAHVAHLRGGPALPYDVIVLAFGVEPQTALPGALTFRGPADVEALRRLLADIRAGRAERVVFALPSGVVWPLPLYELALLTAAHLEETRAEVDLTLATPEPTPLALFGARASDAVQAALEERGVDVRTTVYPQAAGADGLLIHTGETIAADRVVTLPRLRAREIGGVPRDRAGFVPTDAHGAVPGVPDVYAAGDLTAFPIKQGGLAAQQADAVAEAIAARAGMPIAPRPFQPVLKALLLGARAPTFLRVELGGGRGETSQASEETLWWPPGKIVGRHLAPFLAGLGVLEVAPEPEPDALRIEIEQAGAHMLGWPR